jgi:GNAT superfamily N-acetyltransferase
MQTTSERDLDYLHQITYKIFSSLEYTENNRYVQDITGEITRLNEDQQTYTVIGHLSAYKILLGVAEEAGWDAFSIFDVYHYTLEIGEQVYDLQKDTWDDKILKYYDDNVFGSDLLIGSQIEILPAYRGQGIGPKAIKDLYNNFIQGCALFAIKCFPLQSEALLDERSEPFAVSMCYDKMEKDYRKAFRRLSKFYKSIGFENIPGLPKEIMLINPWLGNKKFEAIELD